MTFKEWLIEQGQKREERIKNGCTYRERLFDPMVCADALWIDAQASENHLCEPEENLTDGEYESVELYVHNDIDEIEPWNSSKNSDGQGGIYSRVPVDVVEELLNKHGGIDLGKCKEALENRL